MRGICSYFVPMPNPRFKDQRLPNERTLRDILDDRLALFFECGKCERLSMCDLLHLVWKCGPDAKVGTVRLKTVCSRCGSRGGEALLRDSYIRGEFQWFPRGPKASR
jgi:hypothetical protein